MSIYHIRLDNTDNRDEIISSLNLLGTVTEFSEIPKLLEWEGPDSVVKSFSEISGIRSFEKDEPGKIHLSSQTHDVALGMEQGTAQLPIIWHGQRPGDRYYNSIWDLLRPGQKAVFNYDPTDSVGDGTGVNIYLIDSGIEETHPEFTGRFGGRLYNPFGGDPPGDHGMAVSTCSLGLTMGVAPGATSYDCRAFPSVGSTTVARIITAINAALTEHNNGTAPGVVSCSFGGGGFSDPYDAAVEACVDAGLPLVAAAGNFGDDLSGLDNHWPAENPDVIAVGGCDRHFRIHPRSNRYGPVELYASYHSWTIAQQGGDFRGQHSWRGTSFSCPLVAGMVARILTGTTKMTTRAEVETLTTNLMDNYTAADVIDVDGTPLLSASRLYIPGVTFSGFENATPPTRGIPESSPINVKAAGVRVLVGSPQNNIAVKKAKTYVIIQE